MKLTDCYITATLRCVPPENKPAPKEIHTCRSFLLKEIELLRHIRVVLGLGRIGFDAALNAYREVGTIAFTKKPTFFHGAAYSFGELTFIASFHPSQQNTFTGKLTERMFDRIFSEARKHIVNQRGAS